MKTGYIDENGKEICYGDVIEHAIGCRMRITTDNVEECMRVSRASGWDEGLGGWRVIESKR